MAWVDLFITGRSTRRPVDLASLPATIKLFDGRVVGWLVVVFALLWGGLPGSWLVTAWLDGDSPPPVLLLFPVLGLGLLSLGVLIAHRRKRVTLTGGDVHGEEQWFRRRKSWSVPRADYAGVLLEPTTVRRNNASFSAWRVALHHDEAAKTVPLMVDTDYAKTRAAWEDYARELGMTAFEGEAAAAVPRAREDLDKSVPELAAEGRLEIDFAARPPPVGLVAAHDGAALVVTSTRPRNTVLGMCAILAVPALILVIALAAPPWGYLVGAVDLLLLLAMAGAVILDLMTRERLRVDSDGIRLSTLRRGRERPGKRIAARAIEGVTVARTGALGPRALILAGDAARLEFGRNQSADALQWLREAVLTHLAGGT